MYSAIEVATCIPQIEATCIFQYETTIFILQIEAINMYSAALSDAKCILHNVKHVHFVQVFHIRKEWQKQ